jgi:hypothetical protein
MSQAVSTVLDIEQLNQLAPRLRDTADDIRNPALVADMIAAANVASEHADWRFALSELTASLPAGTHARNELRELLGKEIAAAKPVQFCIFYEFAKEDDAPAFLKLAHCYIDTLERAIEILKDPGEQGKIYRKRKGFIVECRPIERLGSA